MNEPTKSEDQIAKDKEAVKAMTGAKAAMEASLRRIDTLETALKSVRRQAEIIGKAFSDEVHLRVYVGGSAGHEVKKARSLFDNIDNTIKAVL